MKILVVGSGYMAGEYAAVLKDLNVDFSIVGRSESSCNILKKKYPDINIYSGGIENFNNIEKYNFAIITTNVEFLLEHSILVMNRGIRNLLVEKPGGKNLSEVKQLFDIAQVNSSKIFIAYNRRFYASVEKFINLLESDSKILSFNFEFTEWPHTLELFSNQEAVKENLFYANSSHLIDLAFFLNGKPKQMSSISTDKLAWHKKAIYAGIGMTDKNSVFSYQANWKGPGRWGLEMISENFRYYFRPLEELWIQKQKTVKLEKVEIDNYLDIKYKPGLFKQVNAFLFNQSDKRLIDIVEQYNNCKEIYEVILNGSFTKN